MQAIASRDTKPELDLRRRLWAMGLRYRVDTAPIPTLNRRADVVFPRQRVACFVDGCFWHGCPDHGSRSRKVNSWYWGPKLVRTMDRDKDTTSQLSQAGWLVVRIWEHEDMQVAAELVATLVRDRTPDPPSASTNLGLVENRC